LLLNSLKYNNFRNHQFLYFKPADGITIIYGKNGSGKTSLLEGVHYCALTKGLVGANDSECLSFLSEFFLLDANFTSDNELPLSVKVTYTKEKEKKIIVNNSEVKPFSLHIGRIPCIIFTPSEMVIVTGSPIERRRFMDNAICQTNSKYLHDLMAYRRVLTQRNALLLQIHEKHNIQKDMLSLWTEHLAVHAAAIVYARVQFIDAFNERFKQLYAQFSLDEHPCIVYRSSLPYEREQETSLDHLSSFFYKRYLQTEDQEIFRSQTITGPHRDELQFLINNKDIKKYASQGQLRTFLITLKLSLHQYFLDFLDEKPICLLDDIFSELDASRVSSLFKILEPFGQTIITSTEKIAHQNVTTLSIESFRNP